MQLFVKILGGLGSGYDIFYRDRLIIVSRVLLI